MRSATEIRRDPRGVAPSRLDTTIVVVAAFLALVVLRGTVLVDPPYGDALLGLFPQAHWHALHGTSPLALLREQPGYLAGGASAYPSSVIPPLLALLERAVSHPETRLTLLHLASFACAALACGAVHRLVRPYGRTAAFVAAAAFLAQPGVQALACQIGLEMPLIASLAWTVASLADGRPRAAFASSVVALLVQPAGVVAPAVALVVHVARAFAPERKGAQAGNAGSLGARARVERRWAVAHLGLCLLFAVELLVIAAFERAPSGAGPFAGALALATNRLWTVPEFGLVLVALAIAGAVAIVRRRSGAAIAPATLASAVFLLAYVVLLAQRADPFPRHFVAAYPAAIALLAAALARFAPRTALVPVLAALALFGAINAHGRFHPDRPAHFEMPGDAAAGSISGPLASNDGWLLERSMRYRDGLLLDREIAHFAADRPEAAFVAPWPLEQALVEPAFGYVTEPLDCVSAEMPLAWTDRALSFADLVASGREILWILTPNDFAGETSRPLPGDFLVARFGIGAQRAFVVRRELPAGTPHR